ncbi:MAG: riboflavin kinase [Ilumatobacter fluminis]|uniref:riboflavin kinase n=1 Tax=Ilumatobacter fluminis TaxID=467091 RepID=UPI0032ECC997
MDAPERPTVIATRGVVEHGDQRGRTIGFPTANLPLETDDLLDGVWAGWVDVAGDRHLAAVSIGNRPTFYGTVGYRLLEAHLLDFEGDLYDTEVTVVLWHHLREQIRFDSIDDLVSQLAHDVERCRELATTCPNDLRALRPLHTPVGVATAVAV